MSLQGSWRNPFGPGALNNLIFFVVEESAVFNCDAVGSRCSFLRSDWGDVDDDGGAIADQIEGAVWTVSKLESSQCNVTMRERSPICVYSRNTHGLSPQTQTKTPPHHLTLLTSDSVSSILASQLVSVIALVFPRVANRAPRQRHVRARPQPKRRKRRLPSRIAP